MGALLDEMACLARDFLVLKAAPNEGVGMLSGVATDAEAVALSNRFSYGELVRMVGVIQATLASFNRISISFFISAKRNAFPFDLVMPAPILAFTE